MRMHTCIDAHAANPQSGLSGKSRVHCFVCSAMSSEIVLRFCVVGSIDPYGLSMTEWSLRQCSTDSSPTSCKSHLKLFVKASLLRRSTGLS